MFPVLNFSEPISLNTPFFFLIPDKFEEKIKKLAKQDNIEVNKYQYYYQLLFIVHIATIDYLEFCNEPKKNLNERKRYKGIQFWGDEWCDILGVEYYYDLSSLIEALNDAQIFKDLPPNVVSAPDISKINIRKKTNFKLLNCPPQFLVLVNQMNRAYFDWFG